MLLVMSTFICLSKASVARSNYVSASDILNQSYNHPAEIDLHNCIYGVIEAQFVVTTKLMVAVAFVIVGADRR
jgi:hypothetical protein